MRGQECAGAVADAQRLGSLHAVQEAGAVAVEHHEVGRLADGVRQSPQVGVGDGDQIRGRSRPASPDRLESRPRPVDLVAVLRRESLEDEHREDPVSGRTRDTEPVRDIHHPKLVELMQQPDDAQGIACGTHRIRGAGRAVR